VIRIAALVLMLGLTAQEHPLQEALRDNDPEGPWHYNDLATGIAEAKASGKPLLVVFRCTV
jgi:hypothetical protein